MSTRSFTLFLLTLFLSVSIAFAAPAPAPTGTVGGQLLDQESKSPLDHVTVFIYQGNNTKPVKVANTDEKGIFVFSDILPGEYRIEAGFLGYLPFEDVVQVLANQQTHLGEIGMKTDAKALKVVEVTGLRSTMKLEVDKKVFSVDQSIAAAGASTTDILRNIPSVEVDAEGNISLRNSSNVIIWINGKPSGLTSDNRAQILEQMPAESIERIEVISNPSAKFSAEGSAGIINIILKKDRKAGYYGSLRAGVSHPTGLNFGGNVNYSSPKWDLYANLGTRSEKRDASSSNYRETYTGTGSARTTDYMSSSNERYVNHEGLFVRGGADYHVNNQHTVSLSGFGMKGSRDIENAIVYQFENNNKELYNKRLRNSTDNGSHDHYEVEMNYQWEIAPEHSLQVLLSAGNGNFPGTSDYQQFDYNGSNVLTGTSRQKDTGTGSEDEMDLQIDYSRKFSESWKMELGWKSSLSNRIGSNNIQNLEGSDWHSLSNNEFDYDEQIHAAYGTLSGKFSTKMGYQLGLRAEQAIIDFTSTDLLTNLPDARSKKYLELFPTVFVNYTPMEGSDLQLNYSRRINRPRGRALNPYVNISDSTNIWMGNPDLDPEFTNAFEFNFLKTWAEHTLSASLYHRMSTQVIQDIRYLENGIIRQSPQNATSSTSSGMELVAKDKLFRILETTSTLNFFRQTMDGFVYRGESYAGTKGFSWNFRMNGQLMMPNDFIGQFSAYYTAPRLIAQGEMKAAYSLDLGIRKSLMDRKLQLSLSAQNLLNSFKFESISRGAGFYQEMSNQFGGRTIRLNVAWNFGNLKPKDKGNKKDGQENSGGMEGDF